MKSAYILICNSLYLIDKYIYTFLQISMYIAPDKVRKMNFN